MLGTCGMVVGTEWPEGRGFNRPWEEALWFGHHIAIFGSSGSMGDLIYTDG